MSSNPKYRLNLLEADGTKFRHVLLGIFYVEIRVLE